MDSIDRLFGYLKTIEGYIPYLEKENSEVSKVNIAWQLDHCLNVLISIPKALSQTKEKEIKPKPTISWYILGSLYWIPRGKARSPKIVAPEGELTEEKIRGKIKEAEKAFKALAVLNKNATFRHPYFGDLNKSKAIRFMGMHTHHHLKICRDILA